MKLLPLIEVRWKRTYLTFFIDCIRKVNLLNWPASMFPRLLNPYCNCMTDYVFLISIS
jgi:hypothetical protein